MKPEELVGKYIRFTKVIEEQETIFDEWMMAHVVRVKDEDTESGVYELICDFSMFEKYNRTFANLDYYDSAGEATLYVWETNFYPKKLRESIYTDKDQQEFNIVSDEEAIKIADIISITMSRQDRDLLLALLEQDMQERKKAFETTEAIDLTNDIDLDYQWREQIRQLLKGTV